MSIINEFKDFILESNLGATILATIISTYITELGMSFSDNLILPIIDQDLDGDGKPDSFKLKKLKLKINGCTLKIGEFILTLFKVFLMFIVIFIIQKCLSKSSKELKTNSNLTADFIKASNQIVDASKQLASASENLKAIGEFNAKQIAENFSILPDVNPT